MKILLKIIINILSSIYPDRLCSLLLPNRFIVNGHIISNIDHILKKRFRYPNFKEFSIFVDMMRRAGYTFVKYEDYINDRYSKMILLTFDDGYIEVFSEMHTYLIEMKLPYMIFILTTPLSDEYFVSDSLMTFSNANVRYYLNINEILHLRSKIDKDY